MKVVIEYHYLLGSPNTLFEADSWTTVRDTSQTNDSRITDLKSAVDHLGHLCDWSVEVMKCAHKVVVSLEQQHHLADTSQSRALTTAKVHNSLSTFPGATNPSDGRSFPVNDSSKTFIETGNSSSKSNRSRTEGNNSDSYSDSAPSLQNQKLLEETVDRIVLNRLGLINEYQSHTSHAASNSQLDLDEEFTHTTSTGSGSDHDTRQFDQSGVGISTNTRSEYPPRDNHYTQQESWQSPSSNSYGSKRGSGRNEVISDVWRSSRESSSPISSYATSQPSVARRDEILMPREGIQLKQSLHEPELSSIGSPTQRQRRQISPSRSQPSLQQHSANTVLTDVRSSYPQPTINSVQKTIQVPARGKKTGSAALRSSTSAKTAPSRNTVSRDSGSVPKRRQVASSRRPSSRNVVPIQPTDGPRPKESEHSDDIKGRRLLVRESSGEGERDIKRNTTRLFTPSGIAILTNGDCNCD